MTCRSYGAKRNVLGEIYKHFAPPEQRACDRRRKHKAWGACEIYKHVAPTEQRACDSRRKHKAWGASPRLVAQ